MKLHAILALTASLGAIATAPAVAQTATPSFAYDSYATLDLNIDTTTQEGTVRIDTIAYKSQGQIVHATLVGPLEHSPSMPGVLLVRDLADVQSGDDAEFLQDAKWLARRGVVSLIPDEPWSTPGWLERGRTYDTDPRDAVAIVIALRRGFDVLSGTGGVDKARLAYVGHGLGATYGALLCGVDLRPAAVVFMTPDLSLAARFEANSLHSPGSASAYQASLAAFDPRSALARSSFTVSLLQFAKRDRYASKADAQAFSDAVPGNKKTIVYYDADRGLALDAATDERRAWLAAHLFSR